MSDRWEQPDPDHPASEMPPAEPMQPPEPAAAKLREFSRWLERWAIYTQTLAKLADGQVHATAEPDLQPAAKAESSSSTGSPSTAGPPAHWHAALTQGPPAHWLALFADQPEVDSTAGLPGKQPQAFEETQPGEAAEPPMAWIRRFQTELANFLPPPDLNTFSPESLTRAPKSPGSLNADVEVSSKSSGVAATENLPPAEPVPAATEAVVSAHPQGPPNSPGEPDLIRLDGTGRESVAPAANKPASQRERLEAGQYVSSHQTPISAEGAHPASATSQESEANGPRRVLTSPFTDQVDSVPVKSVSVSSPKEPGRTTTRQPPTSQALQGTPSAPVAGPAVARVTPIRLRLPSEARSTSRHLDPGSDSLQGHAGPDEPQPAVSQSEPKYLQAVPRLTRLRLNGMPSASQMGAAPPVLVASPGQSSPTGELESELEPESAGQPLPAPHIPAASPAQPDGIPSSLVVDESGDAEPAWPERPRHAKPAPVIWPAASSHSHWPKLPEASPLRNPGSRPYQDPVRRRRIDREQGGR